jgi:Kef-type K+ transport system membrane component KefB
MTPQELRTLVLIAVIAALSPIISDVAARWVRLPGVVVEIGLGIVVGPYVLGWAHLHEVLDNLAQLGLVFLIFLAGFEVDTNRVRGRPADLALAGWLLSLALAFGLAWGLWSLGAIVTVRFVAIALTTTAIGTLLPILGDAGVLPTPLGTNILASGTAGEIGPILAISVVLVADNPLKTTLSLGAFVLVAAAAAWVAARPARPRTVTLIARTLHSSGQLGVRLCVVIIVGLVLLASTLGLDVLLGAFAAGMVARLFLVHHAAAATDELGDERAEVALRLEALGFGFFIPLFFVASGARFNLGALEHWGAVLKIPLFLGLLLLVRGLPAVLYRHDLAPYDVVALGLLQATTLPLLVVITTLGVETGQMRSDNAAALVGAGLLSVVVLPSTALAVRSRGSPAPPVLAAPRTAFADGLLPPATPSDPSRERPE